MQYIQEIIVGLLVLGAAYWLFNKYKPNPNKKNCSKGACGCD